MRKSKAARDAKAQLKAQPPVTKAPEIEQLGTQAEERAHVISLWNELASAKQFSAALTQRLLGLQRGGVPERLRRIPSCGKPTA